MSTTAIKVAGSQGAASVGRQREPIKGKPKTPRELFAARLRQLAGTKSGADLAKLWGCSPDAALKYLRGDRTPPLDEWPKIARGLGLSDWRELLPPID